MYFLFRILNRNLLGQQHHGSFARAICACSRLLPHKAKYGRRIDNPSFVSGRVYPLGKELANGVLAPKEDGASISGHNEIPMGGVHVVYFACDFGSTVAGIIDHTVHIINQNSWT